MIRRILFCLPLLTGLAQTVQAAPSVTIGIVPGTNAVSHTIQKAVDGGVFTVLTTVNMPTTSFTDTAVLLEHTYCYVIQAKSNAALSPLSVQCCESLTAASATPTALNCAVVR